MGDVWADTDRGGKLCKRCCVFFCEVSHVAIGGLGDGGEEYKQTFVESKFNVIDGQST